MRSKKNVFENEMAKSIEKEKAQRQFAESNEFIEGCLRNFIQKVGQHVEAYYCGNAACFSIRAYAASEGCPFGKSKLRSLWKMFKLDQLLRDNGRDPANYRISALEKIATNQDLSNSAKLKALDTAMGRTSRQAEDHIDGCKKD